ncbi:MAG: tyrosine-type recombinase/integrase [Bacteroidota bacterium]
MSSLAPASVFQPFLDHLRFQKRFSAHTILAYATDLQQGFAYFKSAYEVDDPKLILPAMIRSWLAEGKASGLSARTLNRKISTLKSFFKYLVRQGDLVSSPMASIISPKTSKRLPVFLKEEEALHLLSGLQSGAEDWRSQNAQAILTLFYSTGMRLSELISLNSEQIDYARASIKVLGKGNKERVLPLSPHLVQVMRAYSAMKEETFGLREGVFLVTEKGKPLYPKYVWNLVNTYLGGTTSLDKKSPHVLRHTFATHLMNQGADLNAVKELLGHSSLAATQVYTHNTIGKLQEIHRKAHPKS